MIAVNTTGTIVKITDLGIVINPYATYDLSIHADYELANSSTLPQKIADGTLTIRKDGEDLSTANALKVIYGQSIEPRDTTGKIFMHDTSRPFGTKVHFTGAGDSPDAVSDIGSGIDVETCHHIGDELTEVLYADFNTISNPTWIHEGQLQWYGAQRDKITVEFVPRVITFNVEANDTYLYMPSSPLILPAALAGGAGNVSIVEDITQANGGLVQALPNEKGVKPPAYWNADYDSGTGLFSNIQPALTGNGNFNLFWIEYTVARFANRIAMIGSNVLPFHTEDIDPMPHGVRLKATWETIGDDHDWGAAASFKMYRTKSC